MADRRDPLWIDYLGPAHGLTLARQTPPPSAATAAITYVGPGGSGYDPEGREGTAEITAHLVTSGAGPLDRAAFARELDRLGASVRCEVAPESVEVTIAGPTGEWPRLLDLLSEVVVRPRFASEDVERVLRQIRERQLRESSQPASRAERELLHRIFPPGHPYRETGIGSPESIDRIDRARIQSFHRRHYTGEGGTLVATVPADAGRIEREVVRRFRQLEGRPAPRTVPLPELQRAPETREIELADRSQAEVWVGGASIARSDPTYPAAALANEILGGRPMLNRLFQALRERAGLAYHATSELESMRWGGFWTAHAGTNPKSARRAADLLHREIARLAEEPPSSAELRTIRESALGEIALALETTPAAHELALDVAYHRLPSDFWRRWPGVVRAVRPRAVADAAAEALDGSRAITILCGSLRTPRGAGRPNRRAAARSLATGGRRRPRPG